MLVHLFVGVLLLDLWLVAKPRAPESGTAGLLISNFDFAGPRAGTCKRIRAKLVAQTMPSSPESSAAGRPQVVSHSSDGLLTGWLDQVRDPFISGHSPAGGQITQGFHTRRRLGIQPRRWRRL